MTKTIIRESGIRDINALAKRYPKAEIYFHQDLDGVTTALAMKKYLEDNGINVVDAHIIQYGDKEFAVKKNDATGDVMPVLVDFAHGKPMFKIHTDHHDKQVGTGYTSSTSFRESPSNVATISQVVSPREIFSDSDIRIISTVDAAKFTQAGLKPKDVMNFLFRMDTEKELSKNKFAMGLVCNKLLLAYKNKPGFLEELVMKAQPSLTSILTNIKRIAKEKNFATPEMMAKNQEDYVKAQKNSPNVKFEDGIIIQYGGGSMFKPGSYDRYTPFENYPEADFIVIAWPMGLVQASCNPYKEDRALKGVNLGEMKDVIVNGLKSWGSDKIIPLSTIKWVSESSRDFGSESVGFTSTDLKAFYGDKFKAIDGGEKYLDMLMTLMDMSYDELTEEQLKVLDKFGVPIGELIDENSGGHKCITNISGLNYYGRSRRKPRSKGGYDRGEDDAPYVALTKNIQKKFVDLLKREINTKS